MNGFCSNLASAYTRWLEHHATAGVEGLALLIITAVYRGGAATRKAAVSADDLCLSGWVMIKAGLRRLLRLPW